MKNFLQAEAYYLRQDTLFRGISLLFVLASTVLAFWTGSKSGYEMNNPVEPLTILTQLSLLLYFIIPVYVCFFTTEGFEFGSVKVILAGGQSRFTYVTGKYLTVLKLIVWWMLLFFGLFYLLYLAAALVTGSGIGDHPWGAELLVTLRVLGLNILYLAAYAALIMLISLWIQRTASAVVATFLVVFGDFMLSGYFRETSSAWLRLISDHTLTTQIMKFSGIYVIHSQHIVLSGAQSFVKVLLIPLIVLIISLAAIYISFGKKDIHT
ncbi:hypothetical protein GCM10010912_52970 [Paenibacillus albidus]|uniref:Uncharacterized protein n=1 Tax=Paenibacillus albidus TaxID=2041023 RepID=A0A917CWJ7_9BACL|nr:hypothetical protein [Paenibacillus albidus]GGG01527.1 hypothetical protein GCM10010912_52970 [Paenibacillus albidus]